jgi:hypothetical protein
MRLAVPAVRRVLSAGGAAELRIIVGRSGDGTIGEGVFRSGGQKIYYRTVGVQTSGCRGTGSGPAALCFKFLESV